MYDIEVRQARLGLLDGYDVAAGETDIRGWLVISAEGQRVGRVGDLVVDTRSLCVRHVEIALDPKPARAAGKEQLVVPIGRLQVAPHRRVLHVRELRLDELLDAPVIGSALEDDEEMILRRFYGGEAELDAQRFWGPRRLGRETFPYVAARTSKPS